MEKTYYLTKEQFITMTATWKSIKDHTAAEHLIYNVLRSKPADHGFTEKYKDILPPGDPLKWRGFNEALTESKWSITKRQFGNYDPIAYFKRIFGIEIPDGLREKLDGYKK